MKDLLVFPSIIGTIRSFQTEPKYIFSYYIADTSTSAGNTVEAHVTWDETSSSREQHIFNVGLGPVGYQFFSFTETASGTSTQIDFHGVDTNGSILVDNVSVVAVPEPGTLALGGACLVLAGLRSKRARLR